MQNIFAERVNKVPPYIFVQISRKIAAKKAQGINVISFGIGDPDLPTPPSIIDGLISASKTPRNHRYPESEGLPSFRNEVSIWYKSRFGIELNPENEWIYLSIGYVFRLAGDPRRAISSFERVASLSPQNEFIGANLVNAYLELERLQFAEGSIETALDTIGEALDRFPDEAWLLSDLIEYSVTTDDVDVAVGLGLERVVTEVGQDTKPIGGICMAHANG